MNYHPFQNDWIEDILDEAEEEIEIEAIVITYNMFYSVLNMFFSVILLIFKIKVCMNDYNTIIL